MELQSFQIPLNEVHITCNISLPYIFVLATRQVQDRNIDTDINWISYRCINFHNHQWGASLDNNSGLNCHLLEISPWPYRNNGLDKIIQWLAESRVRSKDRGFEQHRDKYTVTSTASEKLCGATVSWNIFEWDILWQLKPFDASSKIWAHATEVEFVYQWWNMRSLGCLVACSTFLHLITTAKALCQWYVSTPSKI